MEFCLLLGGFLRGKVGVFVATLHIVVLLVMPAIVTSGQLCVQVRLRIGMYYPFLSDWLRVFPMNQVMVIRYEDYVAKPSEIINKVCKFLGVCKCPYRFLITDCNETTSCAVLCTV